MVELRNSCRGRLAACLVLFMLVFCKADEIPSWEVRNTGGDVCIMMAFKATVKFAGMQEPVDIPSTATADGSSCEDGSSTFDLAFDFDNNTKNGEVSFGFSTNGTEWRLATVNTSSSAGGEMSVTISSEDFTLPSGFYLQCESGLELKEAEVIFSLIDKMQPFVGSSDKALSCEGDQNPSSDLNIGLIVGCVLGGMAVLVITCFVCNRIQKRRQRQKRYRQDAGHDDD